VDENRDFYKSCVGFGEPLATARELEGATFCHYAIAGRGPLVIDDTRAHPVYSKVPTVETMGVAAYLGVPVRAAGGAAIGSLCAIDFHPRAWTATEIAAVTELAASVERELEIRRQHRVTAALNEELELRLEEGRTVNLELEASNEALRTAVAEAEAARDRAAASHAEAQRARVAAERANLAKSQFLAAMSHEIRTPINAVLGYTDLLDAAVAGPLSPRQREYVSRVQASSRHLLGLIEEVLDFSKIEAGEMVLAREASSVEPAVRASVDMIAPQAAAKGIALTIEEECESADRYLGDEYRVRQVLVNLLSNALKFTEPGGSITVRCRAADQPPVGASLPLTGPWVVVEVADTGCGIAPEQLTRIFAPFVQATPEIHRRPSGTGLGLTISRRLARLMGGDLRVESEIGVGSTFSLWLAAVEQDRVLEVEWSEAEPPAGVPLAGAAEVGTLLLESARELELALIARLRADRQVPSAAETDDLSLENQTGAVLTALGKELRAIARGSGDAFDEASRTLETLYANHGRQRRRMGWEKAELAREYQILHDLLDIFVRAEAARRTHSDLVPALDALHREVSRGSGVSLAAFAGPEAVSELSDEQRESVEEALRRSREMAALTGDAIDRLRDQDDPSDDPPSAPADERDPE
ncbi:MAG TPA: ATP-binding protein, partial [Longimicrobium sp.]|nr:ATP-binding protein [Longimicrobium sp.]